jgi:hypothetical protein
MQIKTYNKLQMLCEFHLHTKKYSACSCLSFKEIFTSLKAKNIDCVAITDHNEIDGAKEFKAFLKVKKSDIKVIIGEEIATQDGEIIGLFLTERIPKGKDLKWTAKEIIKQNGLIVIPHPFDPLRRKALQNHAQDILGWKPIIEVFNSRAVFPFSNKKAKEFCEKNKLLEIAGSDAHELSEVGQSTVEIDDFQTKDEFLKNLKKAKFHTKKNPIFPIFKSAIYKKIRRILK